MLVALVAKREAFLREQRGRVNRDAGDGGGRQDPMKLPFGLILGAVGGDKKLLLPSYSVKKQPRKSGFGENVWGTRQSHEVAL